MLDKRLTKKRSSMGDAVVSLLEVIVPTELPNSGQIFVKRRIYDSGPVIHFHHSAVGSPEETAGRSVWLLQNTEGQIFTLYYLSFRDIRALLSQEELNRDVELKMPLRRIEKKYSGEKNLFFEPQHVLEAAVSIRDFLIYNSIPKDLVGDNKNANVDAEHF